MASLLQGDEIFFNKILSRDASQGLSSHIYHREANGVPFKWESQPGTPIHPHVNGSLPPLSPPPAALVSYATSHPFNNNKTSRSSIWFWKKNKKSRREDGSDRADNYDFWNSDVESICSPRDSHSSSYSESSSSFEGSSSPVSKNSPSPKTIKKGKIEDDVHWPVSCTPWSVKRIMTCIHRKT